MAKAGSGTHGLRRSLPYRPVSRSSSSTVTRSTYRPTLGRSASNQTAQSRRLSPSTATRTPPYPRWWAIAARMGRLFGRRPTRPYHARGPRALGRETRGPPARLAACDQTSAPKLHAVSPRPRPRHQRKELEQVLKIAEAQGWRIARGKAYFKMKCGCDAKHMKMMHATPSDPNYKRHLVAYLKRETCWRED